MDRNKYRIVKKNIQQHKNTHIEKLQKKEQKVYNMYRIL